MLANLREELQQKIDQKTKPLGALGKLEEIALRVGLIQGTASPSLRNPALLVFAGDHGLADAGVSAYPKDVTWQMVMNFIGGGAAVNVFCRQHGISLQVVDAGVAHDFDPALPIIHAKIAHGTRNLLDHPAMTAEQLDAAFETATRLIQGKAAAGCNCIALGEMGIGNTSAAALLMHKYLGLDLADCTGAGTGVRGEALQRKLAILERAAARHDVTDPREILRTYGGLEIAMMTAAYLEAHRQHMVILVDGFIATAALLAARELDGSVLDSCLFSHCSDEAGHARMLQALGASPILELGMRLGEGTGAAVAFPVVRSAVAFLNEMSSFDEAGVAGEE
jgi:nicotinate-nucleotide--dimethylbenzimidazole phosphoribosyltransferase